MVGRGRCRSICTGGSSEEHRLETPEGTQPVPPEETPPAKYHDQAEVLAAFRALSAADMKRLMSSARFRMFSVRGRLPDLDAEDLLHEAMVKTLNGERRWRHGVSFMKHMTDCMRSIANNWLKRAIRFREARYEDLDAQAELSGALSNTREEDLLFSNDDRMNTLRRAMGNDAIAANVLDSLADGYSPAEAEALLRISDKVYWAARKTIRRRVEALFPKGHS
jgi:DNA-directed RNA polymerase specialized sigma24 family protein